MKRNKIDLTQLPKWQQYLIALVIVAIVVAAALVTGKDNPVPAWISQYLIPGLGWLGLILILLAVGDWVGKRLRSRKPSKE